MLSFFFLTFSRFIQSNTIIINHESNRRGKEAAVVPTLFKVSKAKSEVEAMLTMKRRIRELLTDAIITSLSKAAD